MANYLFKKYKNRFRVKADFDLSTNDFPRDELGNIDSSFDDFYIPCASNGKIRHYGQNVLLYYCPSLGRFRNILKQIYTDKVENIDKFQTTIFDYDSMYKELLEKQILTYIDEFDSEGEFRFKTDLMDYIASLVKPNTSGSSISPLSIKNLPSKKYNIPTVELDKYKDIIKVLEKNEMILLTRLIKQFDSVIQAKKSATYNVNAERKLSCLSGKEYIHSIGLFDDYLKFLQDEVVLYQKEKIVP